MRRLLLTMLALAALSPAVAAPPSLQRGVGLHEWLNWSPLLADGSYRWPPFKSEIEWLTSYRLLEDWPPGDPLARVAALGFDFVRLTVDPGPMLASSGARRAEAISIVVDVARRLNARGLNVVVNLHANNQVPEVGAAMLERGEGSPGVAGYRQMATELAAALVPLGTHRVAIEPFNEPWYYPCDGTGSGEWQRIMAAQVAAIRAVSSELTVIANGACSSGIDGLLDLDPDFDDANLMWTFHMYEPLSFTHQRDDAGGWYSGLPWPVSARSREDVLDRLRARMAAAGASLVEQDLTLLAAAGPVDEYYAEGWGEERLEARLQSVLDWAAAHDIPPQRLFLGEFGVIRLSEDGRIGAEDEDRLRYVAAVRQWAEAHGIAWSIWEYSNPWGMSVIEPEGPAEPDRDLLGALGLPQ